MSHEFESGFTVGRQSWHGLEKRIPEDKQLSVPDALEAAGLDWEVGLVPLVVAPGEAQEGQPVPGRATFRKSDGKILGVVGMRYRCFQNLDAFKWFQPFLDSGEASFETAGSLKEGRRTWVLAKLNRAAMEIVPGDSVEKYLLLSNSHDGTTAIRVGFSPIRVVCWNTLSMAERNGASQLLKVRHTGSAQENLESIRATIDAANARFEATAEQYRMLAAKDISQSDVRKYVKRVFGVKEDEKPSTRKQNILEEVIALTEAGAGNDRPEVTGTCWAAYNGVSEYLSHKRGRSADSRQDSLWFGDSANVNRVALEAAIELCQAS